jgi:hypothetical protein
VFEETDVSSDEAVLTKLLDLAALTLRSDAGASLADHAVSDSPLSLSLARRRRV